MPSRLSKPSSRRPARKPQHTRGKTRVQKVVRKSLLILQLDSEKLAKDRLDLDGFSRFVASFLPKASAVTVRATSFDNLLASLAELHGTTFDAVAVVGHSNERGIVLGAGRTIDTWEAFARYLAPFAPRRLVLVACRAGGAIPSRTLFAELPSMRRLYATPVLASGLQGKLMIALLPHLAERKIPSRELLRTAQGALALLQGRQLWEWRRVVYDRDKHDPLLPLVQDFFAKTADSLLSELRATFA